ncbi:MAG: MauE/DoxX family redox-associated membrane protein [Desulfovibrionales bacterium]
MRRIFFLLQIIFGVLFLWSGVVKALEPAAFSSTIATYGILPGSLINAAAIFLPWIEIAAGAALFTGRFAPGALLILNLLLVVFLGALSLNIFNGVNASCGCFSIDPAGASMREALIRNIVLLCLGSLLMWQSFRGNKV